MSPKLTLEASQALVDLMFAALNNAVETVRDCGSLSPFVLTVGSDGAPTPILFGDEQLEEAVAQAREFIATLPLEITMYVMALEVYLTIEGQKYDAVMVEGGERGRSFAYQFGQRYRPASDDAPFETIGNPAFLGQIEQRLTG